MSGQTVKPFEISTDAAIGGDKGIQYLCRTDHALQSEVKLPFFHKNWLRFSLRVDHWPFLSNPSETLHVKDFLNVNFGEPLTNEQPSTFLRSMLYSLGDTLFLGFRLRFTSDESMVESFKFPISVHGIHTIELGWFTETSDTISFLVYLDGVRRYAIRKRYPFAKDFVDLRLFSYKRSKEKPVRFSLDEFALSDKRVNVAPPKPGKLEEYVSGDSVVLKCSLGISFSKGIHKATRWVLYGEKNLNLPLYVAEEVDSSLLYSRLIPFKLDSGSYSWYSYFVNDDYIAGGRSTVGEFLISTPQISKTIRIKDINVPDSLEAGGWYEWEIITETPFTEKDDAYFIVSLTHPSYIFGHPGNKGGAYICSLNTVFNVSIGANSEVLFFEKKVENSLKSKKLEHSTIGQTMDFSDGAYLIQHDKGLVHFRAKVPDSALFGDWIVSAYAVDKNNVNTNIVRRFVRVVKHVDKGRKGLSGFGIMLIIGLFVIGFLFYHVLRKKKKSTISAEADPVFDLISDYVKSNIRKDLSIKDISLRQGLSVKAVQEALKRNGYKTFPAFINKQRMDKAIEMLGLPNLSVAEISYSLGFDDPDYFSRVFKNMVGVKPTVYRKRSMK